MLYADVLLNTVWALVCAGALIYHFNREARRSSSTSWMRTCRALAVILAAVSLFPCVSASDDAVRTQYFESTQTDPQHPQDGQHRKTPEKSLATLVRLLEALDSAQIAVVWVLAVALCFFALVSIQRRPGIESFLIRRPGRSPPFSLSAA